MSPDQNEFTNRRPTDPDSKNGNGSRKESDDRDPCESETLNRSRESFENNSQKGRQNQSRTPQKHESKRSVSPQAKKLKLENISGPSESNRKSDVIVLDSDDELGIVNPIVDEAPMTDDDAANDDDDQRLKPSQSVGNLSMNSDELNYSASSVGSEPFNEEDESWTVLDCVEGESDKGSEHATSEKEDGYNREMELPSSSRIDEYKPRRRRTRPSRRVRSRKPAHPIDGHSPADEEEFLGLCKPVDGDGHSLSQFFEPNPTKFIAATYRMRNLPFRFVKNVLVEACEELGEDVKVIPCKRDFNAAPYDYVTMIFPDASLAAEWHSRHNGKIVTEFRHQTLEIFLYFHLGNWTCENCEAINFPLRTICYSCFLHKDGGYSPVQMLNSPSRFIAIYKLGNIRANGAVKPFIGLFKRNPYKRLHLIRDPRTNHFSGICVIEMPNRVKGQSLFQRLPAEYKNESRCAYVKMMQPDEDYEIGDVRLPTRKKHASSKMPFQHFRDLQKRAQLPKHRVPKPDGRGLLVYPPPDKEQFTFEPITKMYYDPITGLYFHPHSNLFYNDELHICLRWDADRSSYLYIDTADVE
ncbi:Hypothetical protein NTJ_06063 [Nesidiocoris tenuis]|uniref:RanBP2-type domain-containing protein n=1 Tax=Nesidiocoris tenuis TaxID=355587 RepID=A0ABN7APP7_9HEMI|nr:Hypothetical protein NTJ_06063 [Nesidiocoris tenuis]